MSKNMDLCDVFAKELLGAEMEALGFQYFYKHRFIKIINDEVMIWISLLPEGAYWYRPLMSIIPLLIDPFEMIDMDGNTGANESNILTTHIDMLEQNLQFKEKGMPERLYMMPPYWFGGEKSYQPYHEATTMEDVKLIHNLYEPVIKRITNLETAIKELLWLCYIRARGGTQQKQPPIPENVESIFIRSFSHYFCIYYRLYDLYEKEIFPGLKYPSEYQEHYYKMCRDKQYDQLEAEIQQEHAKVMAKAKRRLKYVPEKSTLFASDNPTRDNPPDLLHIPQEYYAKIDVENGCVIHKI